MLAHRRHMVQALAAERFALSPETKAPPVTQDADPPGDTPSDGDAHGRAALLLVESLIHGLTERAVLTVREAVEIMEVAVAAQEEIAEDAPRPSSSMFRATALLRSLAASLQPDVLE